jgi:hypothetical protein
MESMMNLSSVLLEKELPTVITCSSTKACKKILEELEELNKEKTFFVLTPMIDLWNLKEILNKRFRRKVFLILVYPECGNHVKDTRKNLKEFFKLLITKNKLKKIIPVIITLSDIVTESLNEIIYLHRDNDDFKVRHLHFYEDCNNTDSSITMKFEEYIVYWNNNGESQQIKNMYAEEYIDIIRIVYGVKDI